MTKKIKAYLQGEFGEERVSKLFSNPLFIKKLKNKLEAKKTFMELVSFARQMIKDKEENTYHLHTYTLTYKANFPHGSERDQSLHYQIVQFISSKAGVIDVELKSNVVKDKKESMDGGKEFSVKINDYYGPVKTIFLEGDVFLKDELLRVTHVDEASGVVELDYKYKLDLELLKNFFEKYEF